MSLETDLARTFTAHEHLAPDADHVLAGVDARTASRRPAVRPWAVAATVAVMAAVAAGAVAVVSDDAPAPTSVAGSPSAVASSAESGTTAPVAPAIAPLTMPFDVGWLPEGTADYLARRTQINVSNGMDPGVGVVEGEYLLTVTSADRFLDVDVQQMLGSLDDVSFKSGPGVDTTIGGRPAVESGTSTGPGGYEVYFLDPAGKLVYVNVANSPPGVVRPAAPATELQATGRRIAESVTVPGTTRLSPDYGVGYLPAGLQVLTFEVASDTDAAPGTPGAGDTGTRTSYGLGAPSASDPAVAIFVGTAPGTPPATPGRAVQGHASTLTDDAGYRTLVVEDAVGGRSICIAATLAADELYRIADGLVLPS